MRGVPNGFPLRAFSGSFSLKTWPGSLWPWDSHAVLVWTRTFDNILNDLLLWGLVIFYDYSVAAKEKYSLTSGAKRSVSSLISCSLWFSFCLPGIVSEPSQGPSTSPCLDLNPFLTQHHELKKTRYKTIYINCIFISTSNMYVVLYF